MPIPSLDSVGMDAFVLANVMAVRNTIPQYADVACGMIYAVAREIVDDIVINSKVFSVVCDLVAAYHYRVEHVENMILHQGNARALVSPDAAMDTVASGRQAQLSRLARGILLTGRKFHFFPELYCRSRRCRPEMCEEKLPF